MHRMYYKCVFDLMVFGHLALVNVFFKFLLPRMSKFRGEVGENMQALCPHQVDLLEQDPVLNVFNSQLCSPTEENL